MNYNADIERLKKELSDKEKEQRELEQNCKHQWMEVKYDPEEYLKPEYSHLEGHGSDPYPVYNYYPAKKDRWSRKCEICGKVEYTYEQAPIKYAPKF